MIIPIIPIWGIPLHLKQNNITYHYTGKNIARNFLIKKRIQKRSIK